ncbi:MAG: DUF4347 domain-containing protein, partial [Geobacteraceae bacterium]|nr:DUF4347 domain-containing protein [Geobacteraceae bacterium]
MSKTMVFFDSRVNDLDLLISQFEAGTEYRVLDARHDGLLQIEELLAGKSDYSSIQIISHGALGSITIGSTLLNSSNLYDYLSQLETIGQALSDSGDLLLYGCNVGAGDAGQQFVEALSQMTGADVAASDDLTGGTIVGGDWELEVTSGDVDIQYDSSIYLPTYNSSLIIVPTDPDDPAFIVPKGQYDGVVLVETDKKYFFFTEAYGSGSLLWDGKHILTAAHVVCEKGNETPLSLDKLSIQFRLLDGGTVKIEVKTVYVHHDYNIEEDSQGHLIKIDYDIAIIELETEAPADADRYQIYRDHDEIGKLVTHVGYGLTGTGEKGSTESDYEARYGNNTYDMSQEDSLVYDFDDGTPENDFFGNTFEIHHTGVGAREVLIAPGDSGGPAFIDGKIAGVHSFAEPPSDWGSYAGDTRVSQYATWIDGIISGSTFCGTESNDILSMGDEANYMYGYGGNDFLSGGGGNDTIDGDNGSDTLRGREGDDLILGGAGNDAISGQWGNDTIDGGPGNDTVQFMGNFADYAISLEKDGGVFTVVDSVAGRDGTDQITKAEVFKFANDDTWNAGDACTVVNGTSRIDYVYGNDLNNRLFGGEGDDVLEGKKGNDTIDGGIGSDTVIFTGTYAEYIITQNADLTSYTITDTVADRDGTDLVNRVEQYRFYDGVRDAAHLIDGGGGGTGGGNPLIYTGRPENKMFPGHTSGEWTNGFAFAALRDDGSVVTWGDSRYGGDSSAVASMLNGTVDVVEVFSSGSAFAALREDGSVVTWGWEYSSVNEDSDGYYNVNGDIDVVDIYGANYRLYALREDGEIFFLGDDWVASIGLSGDVKQIFSNYHGIIILYENGSVMTAGADYGEGYGAPVIKTSEVADYLNGEIDVIQVFTTNYAIAALREDGSVVTWGESDDGGNSSAVASKLDGTVDVVEVFSTAWAFAALREDGSVVTWGDSRYGGDSSAVASKLDGDVDVVEVFSTDYAFAALREDGSVVTWGDSQLG